MNRSRSPDGCSRADQFKDPLYERLCTIPTHQIRLESFHIIENKPTKRPCCSAHLLCGMLLALVVCILTPSVYFTVVLWRRSAETGQQQQRSTVGARILAEKHFVLLPLSRDGGDENWYHFSANASTNADAGAACDRMLAPAGRARLAQVETERQHAALTAHLSSLRRAHWWIGADDFKTEGTFRWREGKEAKPALSGHWARNQPDNWPAQPGEPDEDCVAYMYNLDGEWEWKWNDIDCEAKANYICEYVKDG